MGTAVMSNAKLLLVIAALAVAAVLVSLLTDGPVTDWILIAIAVAGSLTGFALGTRSSGSRGVQNR